MEIFSLDLGNKQTKLKSSKSEYVLPSRYLNQADMPMSVGSSATNNDLHTYSVPFSDDKYVWGEVLTVYILMSIWPTRLCTGIVITAKLSSYWLTLL